MQSNRIVYTLVLIGRYPGKDLQVANALAKAFGLDDVWGLKVVSASPVIVLDGLFKDQADAIHAELADVQDAGCLFQIQKDADPKLARAAWASSPRLRGKLVSEFGGNSGGDSKGISGRI
jgi:hypothetical protein